MTVNERIQAPEGVKKLMEEIWLKHQLGEKISKAQIYMVDLPEPTAEEQRIMAANQAARKPIVYDENELQGLLDNASEKLGGW